MKETQDSLMVRYLLGELPQPEQAALENLLFTSDEAFERMWESENRLVDDYVRGRLTSSSRTHFEEHYLASPLHRRRVTVARELLASADQSPRESEKRSCLTVCAAGQRSVWLAPHHSGGTLMRMRGRDLVID